MKTKRTLIVLAVIVAVMGLLTVSLASAAGSGDLDCEALANSPLREPEGYAEQCLGEIDTTPAGSDALDPTDTAYVFEMRNRLEVVTHVLNNFPVQVQVAPEPVNTYFGLDFDETATILYAHDFNTNQLGTINTGSGAFTPIGPSAPGAQTFTGLTIDPVTGEAYAMGTDGVVSTLYSLNLGTGGLTPIGNTGTALMIDFSINCEGLMVGHDIGTDSFYTIDRTTGSATLIGSHGLAANFAQGMDFDNADGTLYVYAYTGGGTNTYGTVNLATGAITPLAQNNPLGEYEGATQTTCATPSVPNIAISKSPASQNVTTNGIADFTITVTNTGDVDLANVNVSDPLVPACDNPVGALAISQTVSYNCQDTNVTGSYTNVVTVTSDLAAGGTGPTASASAVVVYTSPTGVSLSGLGGDSAAFSPVWLVAILAVVVGLGFAIRRKLTA
jgi:uncharacterized repeat protein (TIGR01451 family)